MRRAAMYGMVGTMTLTFGTIVIPSENFVRQNNRGVQESVIPAVSKEVEAPTVEDVTQTEAVDAQNEADSTNTVNAAAGNAAGTYVCPHTDGNHTPDCPYWDGNCGHTDGNHPTDCPNWDGNCGHADGNHPTDCPNWDGSCGHTDGNHPSDCPNWDGSCGHTDGNHPSSCPNWTGSQGNSGGSGNSASQSSGNGGHHGGGHHGGGHH